MSREPTRTDAIRVDLLTHGARCVRVTNGEEQLGLVGASDDPNRSHVEIEPVSNRSAFMMAFNDPEELTNPSGTRSAGGAAGANTASAVVRGFIAALESDVEIDVFTEPCERICPQRVGAVTVKLLHGRTIEARANAAQTRCRVVGPISFDSHGGGRSGSPSVAPTDTDAAAGGESGAAGSHGGQGGAAGG